MILSLFQFDLSMTVHAARTKKKNCEVNNFWYFLRRDNLIVMFFKKS